MILESNPPVSEVVFESENDETTGNLKLPTLYGRHEELLALGQSFDRVKRTTISENVVVHGESGIGKTSLVLALQNTVFYNNAYFCMGKYSQNSKFGQEPYSAIMTAFSRICDSVFQSSNDERKEEIRVALEADGRYLAKIIPNILPFLKDETDFNICRTENESAFAKFKSACKTFLRVMASDKHPIVLFLDDVQWMDDGSRALVECFLQANDIKSLMLILAYRDDEAKNLGDMFKNTDDKRFLEIALRNLQLNSIGEMIRLQLGCYSGDVDDLCKLIAHKTQGNPFHILEFLESIRKEGFVEEVDGSLTFDMDSIQREMKISDSLAKLLFRKLRGLNRELQQILKVASLLGCRFTGALITDVISEVCKKDRKDILSIQSVKIQLKSAVNQHFLETIDEGYQFSHDKIQAAFQSLLGEREREELYLTIGRKFLSNSNNNSKYQAAIHLNRAWNILKCEGKIFNTDSTNWNIELAKINLEASKYSEERSAFSDSASFLRKGLELLDGKEKWWTTFELALEMTESLARMEFIVGNNEACRVAREEVLLRAKSDRQKIDMLALDIQSRMVDHKLDGSSSKKVFQQLGIRIPHIVTPLHFLWELRKIRKTLKMKNDEDILNVSSTEDPKIVIGMKLLIIASGNCLARKETILAAYMICIAVKLTLEEGLSPFGSLAFCQLGVLESILGCNEKACRLAKLSLKLLQEIPCEGGGCAAMVNAALFSLFRKRHFHDMLLSIPEALDDAFRVGDTCNASYALSMYFMSLLSSGQNLSLIEKLMRKRYAQLSDFGGAYALFCIQPAMQGALNLQRRKTKDWKSLTVMTGEIMKEDEFIRTCTSEMHAFSMYLFLIKMMISFILGFYKEAYKYGKELFDSRHPLFEKSYISIPFKFYFAMTSYMRYYSTGNRKYLRVARKCTKFFKQQHLKENPNILPYKSITDVEEVYIKTKDIFKVCSAYKLALEIEIKIGFKHLEALAHERISHLSSKLDYNLAANTYLDRAKVVYKDGWGATAKYDLIDNQQRNELALRNSSVSSRSFYRKHSLTSESTL